MSKGRPNPSAMSPEDHKYSDANLRGPNCGSVTSATNGAKVPIQSGTGNHVGSVTQEERAGSDA